MCLACVWLCSCDTHTHTWLSVLVRHTYACDDASLTPRRRAPIAPSLAALAELIREPGELRRATAAAERGGASLSGGVLQLASKQPALDASSGTRMLNFGGRVTHGSVKNFQMELGAPMTAEADPAASGCAVLGADGARPLLLQFGKAGKDEFILDFRHPLSPVQAFALGITAIARKLSSEGG
jgi:hypothetical protein